MKNKNKYVMENYGCWLMQQLASNSVIMPGFAVSPGQVTTSVNRYEFCARLFRTGNALTAESVNAPVISTVS